MMTEFYMYASSLDRLRLEHQLEAKRERTKGKSHE